MTSPTVRIAMAESRRQLGFFDRKVLIAAVLVGVILGTVWPAVQDKGVHPEAGLYVVAIDSESPLIGAVESDPAFQVHLVDARPADTRRLDLLILGEEVSYDPGSEKSKAALTQLEGATEQWLDEQLAQETAQDAAFPVRINTIYQKRSVVGPDQQPADDLSPVPDQPDTPDDGQEEPRDGNASEPSNGTAAVSPDADPDLLQQQGTQQVGMTPNELDPPFPLDSLLLTFAYLIPLTFISELYSGSIFAEKVRSRGILLLSGPVTGSQVLVGKSLPYVLVMLLIALGVTVAIGANLVGLAAVVPIVAFVLASSLFLSIVSRSQRALTFLLVSTNVGVSTFLFLPALFTQIEPVAFLSPVAVISATIRGEAVGLGPFLYATVPMAIPAVTLVGLSGALYKSETLFTPAGILTRLADGVHDVVRSKNALVLAGALAVPFAFAAELFVLIFAVTLDLDTAFVVFLLGSALVEEVLKGLPSYAHYTRAMDTKWPPWLAGGLIGLGFFLGEKGALAFTVLGFDLLPKGSAALSTFGIASSPFLVLAPLFLHMGTATITAYASRNGKSSAGVGLLSAVLIHATYNLTIVQLNLGGGLP